MVEVDPAVLIVGSTAIAALLGVVVCMSSQSNKEKKEKEESRPKNNAKNSSKPKKIKEREKKVEKKDSKEGEKESFSQKKTEENVQSNPSPQPASAAEDSLKKKKKAKETPEQRAARLERQKKRKAEEAAASMKSSSQTSSVGSFEDSASPSPQTQTHPMSDGWAVVEDRRSKKKSKPVEVKVEAPKEEEILSQPVSSNVTETVLVDPKKIGGIIGPKGVTLHAIQDMTEVTINTPKERDGNTQAVVSVTGLAEGVAAAVKIIKELNTKGYSKALEGDNFNESAVSVKSSRLSDLIGKNGSCIRAIQDKTGVKISIPPHNDGKAKVRVGLAGTVEAINETKRIIGDIMTFYHSEATHPNLIHKEIDVPERMYNMIIGTRGSEIKHIQNNYKVSVHIPNEESVINNVLVVGEKSAVDGAVKYIEKIVSNINAEEAKVMSIAEDWNEQQAMETGEEEDWMRQYAYNKDQKVSLISKEGADLLEKAQISAWKDSTASDGW